MDIRRVYSYMADGVTLVGYGEGGYIFKSVLFIYEKFQRRIAAEHTSVKCQHKNNS